MPDYQFSVSLKIIHPQLTVEVVSEKLGLCPSLSHDVGDTRVTQKGRLLGGSYEEMLWNLDLCDGKKLDAKDVLLEEFISRKNSELVIYKEFFHEVRSTGGRVDYFIGWFSVDSINMHVMLDPPVLKTTSELGISISLHAYPDD